MTGIYFIDINYPIDTFFKGFNLIITIIILTLVISPWASFKNIKEITTPNEAKLKKVTKFLLIISIFPFLIFIIVTTLLYLTIDDINQFKYSEGAAMNFYYSLPFNVKAFILSTYLYNFSYFLIPLHFYYLGKQKYLLSFLCFILSLNIILHGLTYFSRSVFVLYGLLYFAFMNLLYNTYNQKTKKFITKIIVVLGIVFLTYFAYVSYDRFNANYYYSTNISSKSSIQDPLIYSYFDYLSQWYKNGMHVLNSYDFKTFNSQITFQSIISILGRYEIIDYDTDNYMALRKHLWPQHWFTFNGLVAYSVYDYGYTISLFLALIYYYITKKLKPKNNCISLPSLFIIILLIQIPIMSIFYSTVSEIVIPFLLLIPISIYLKTTISLKPAK